MPGLENMQMQTLRVSMTPDRIVTVTLDAPGKSVNSLTVAMLADLNTVVDQLERENPAGVIFASAKARNFIAGADLFEIRKMDPEQIEKFLADGQALFERISKLTMPTAAAINGDCLGGGLELALGCTTRVAASDGSISIGLPEVKLGILPAWGGTVRLPRLIGLPAALPLLLAGKTMPPRKALKAGIVDEVVRPEVLLEAARRRITQRAPDRSLPMAARAAASVPFVRNRVFKAAQAKTQETTRGNYPAPLRLIDVVRTGIENGPAAGLEAERRALKDLVQTDASQNLLRLFFLRHGAKRAIFDQLHAKPADVKYAAVIGGGTMGSGIVHAFIRAGIQVRLIEVDPKAVSGALGRVSKMLDDDTFSGRINTIEARHAFNRVAPSCEWTGLKLADIVVEAVAEQMDVKRAVFARLDQLTRPDAVLASNTSSLGIADMAAATEHPDRVIGLHFFNPVPKMPLVEVVRGRQSGDPALATAAALSLRIGKTPLLVKDAPGFLVNRVLIPYLDEAIRAAAEGIPVRDIDDALKNWGMPMGPLELMDEIGLDIGLHVLKSFGEHFPARSSIPGGLQQAISNGWLGKKTGRGFYLHASGKRRGEPAVNEEMSRLMASSPTASPGPEELQWRMVLPMVNEAAQLLAEGVVDSADAVDLGTVLGTGFAPFRGGLAHFADSVGSESLVRYMESFSARYGPRFAPSPLLQRLAQVRRPLSEFAEVKDVSGDPAHDSSVAHAVAH